MFLGFALTVVVLQKLGGGLLPSFLRINASADVLLLNSSGDKLIL